MCLVVTSIPISWKIEVVFIKGYNSKSLINWHKVHAFWSISLLYQINSFFKVGHGHSKLLLPGSQPKMKYDN